MFFCKKSLVLSVVVIWLAVLGREAYASVSIHNGEYLYFGNFKHLIDDTPNNVRESSASPVLWKKCSDDYYLSAYTVDDRPWLSGYSNTIFYLWYVPEGSASNVRGNALRLWLNGTTTGSFMYDTFSDQEQRVLRPNVDGDPGVWVTLPNVSAEYEQTSLKGAKRSSTYWTRSEVSSSDRTAWVWWPGGTAKPGVMSYSSGIRPVISLNVGHFLFKTAASDFLDNAVYVDPAGSFKNPYVMVLPGVVPKGLTTNVSFVSTDIPPKQIEVEGKVCVLLWDKPVRPAIKSWPSKVDFSLTKTGGGVLHPQAVFEEQGGVVLLFSSTIEAGDRLDYTLNTDAICVEIQGATFKVADSFTCDIDAIPFLSGVELLHGGHSYPVTHNSYTYSAKVPKVVADAMLKIGSVSPGSSITLNGADITNSHSQNIHLVVGVNEFILKVNCGTRSAVYRLYVTREADDDDDESLLLSSLIPSYGSFQPSFKSNTFVYDMEVPYSVRSIAFTPEAVSEETVISVNGLETESGRSSEAIALHTELNKIIVSLVQETKSTNYTILLTRKAEDKKDHEEPLLSRLQPSRGVLSPDFAPETFRYTMGVPYEVTSLTLALETVDSDATITLNGSVVKNDTISLPVPLSVGANILALDLKDSEDYVTYTVIVTRDSEDKPIDPKSSSSGGCNGGWESLGVILVSGLIIRKRI